MNPLLNPLPPVMPDPNTVVTYIERQAAHDRLLLKKFTTVELESLRGLYDTASRFWDTGGGGVAVRVLLGLYNGPRFPFDLTDLRRLDDQNLTWAINVIEMDASRCRAEVHVVLAALLADRTVQHRMECWAYDLGVPGHASEGEIEELHRRLAA